jgi:hypothetical protein
VSSQRRTALILFVTTFAAMLVVVEVRSVYHPHQHWIEVGGRSAFIGVLLAAVAVPVLLLRGLVPHARFTLRPGLRTWAQAVATFTLVGVGYVIGGALAEVGAIAAFVALTAGLTAYDVYRWCKSRRALHAVDAAASSMSLRKRRFGSMN